MTASPNPQLVERVRAEFLEMPGLRLRPEQLQRLCGVEQTMCQMVLDALVDANVLCLKSDGAYARLMDGELPRPYGPSARDESQNISNKFTNEQRRCTGRRGSMKTRSEIEKAAHLLGDERWNLWMNCGVHDWRALPETDTGEHYCPTCWTLWTLDGAIMHVPDQPQQRRGSNQ